MKYRVKLKTTVTAWVEFDIDDAFWGPQDTDQSRLEWVADDAVDVHSRQLRDRLAAAGLEHGPIELAHEELDESVEVLP